VFRAGVVLGAFLGGVAATLLALYIALCTAPGVIMADDMVGAMLVASAAPLAHFPRASVVYVKSPLGPLLLEKLQREHPSLRLMSYSERPDEAGCGGDGGAAPGERCARDDFVKLEILTAPVRGTMWIATATSNTFGQLLLVKMFGHWWVVVDRSYAA
jgi:hypothetical protein